MVPDDVTCDDILIFDEEVPATQEILTDEMIVSEMLTHESNAKEEEKKEDEQETDVSLSQWNLKKLLNTDSSLVPVSV